MSSAKWLTFSGREQLLNWAVRKLGQFGPMPSRAEVDRALRAYERDGAIRLDRLPDGRMVIREVKA